MTYKYSPHQMLLRQEALKILLGQFGAKNNEKGLPKYQSHIIYECAERWVAAGNLNCDGIIKHFLSIMEVTMQKIINGIAIFSGAVALGVVGLGGYVFIRKDAIIDNVKSKVMEAVTDKLGGSEEHLVVH